MLKSFAIRFVTLCALSGTAAFAAMAPDYRPAAAIYHSFERPMPVAAFAEMQAELARILEPTGIVLTWQPLNAPRTAEYREVFVIRFRGACGAAGDTAPITAATHRKDLAHTEIANGRVLPFAEVDCDLLRRYIEPAGPSRGTGNPQLGRAIARVVAHELGHMVTGSTSHSRTGIGRAEYSREELTAKVFRFGKVEVSSLRAWLARGSLPVATMAPLSNRQ